jgi:hypothetical protein
MSIWNSRKRSTEAAAVYALWTCCLKQDSCFDDGNRHILGPCLRFASFDLARKRSLWDTGTVVSDPKCYSI